MFPFSFKEAVKTLSWPRGRDLQYSLFLNQFVVGCFNVSHFLFCFVSCVCAFFRENFKSYHAYILRENAKISAVRSLADICFLHVLIWLITCIILSVCISVYNYMCLVHSYSFFGSVNATTHSLISSLA